jgi:hypothetical protein
MEWKLSATRWGERVADALKAYAREHNGERPTRLLDLVPKYLSSDRELWFEKVGSRRFPGGLVLCYVPKNSFRSPDFPESDHCMIAFTSSDFDDQRLIIDSEYKVCVWGEGAFTSWLAGKY